MYLCLQYNVYLWPAYIRFLPIGGIFFSHTTNRFLTPTHSLSLSLSHMLLQGSQCIVVIVVVVYTMIHNNIIYSRRDTITNAMTTSVLLGVYSIPDISLPVCVVFAKNDRFRIKQEHWGSILYIYIFLRKPFRLSSIVIIL